MILDSPFVADLLTLRNKRLELMLELVANPTKLGSRTKGPYRVEGTFQRSFIYLENGEHV
jgi:hypothetical protein